MKKFIVVICAAAAALLPSFLLAGPGGTSVGLTSVRVLPKAQVYSAQTWVTNTAYTAGQYVKSGPQFLMCVVAGTSGTSSPVGLGDITDNTVTWRACLGRARAGLILCNNSATEAVYASIKGPAVANQGIRLNKDGGTLVLTGSDAPQGEIQVISPAATNSVTSMDW